MERIQQDLTDQEWAVLAPLIQPSKPGGRLRTTDMREVLNAIFSLLRSGGAWRLLPREFPVGQTVYDYFQHWRNRGGWEQMHTALREEVRRQSGRAAEPWAAIIDAQSVKTTDRGGEQGDEVGKKINGRKRQLLVDTLGLVLKAKVHAANPYQADDVKRADVCIAGAEGPSVKHLVKRLRQAIAAGLISVAGHSLGLHQTPIEGRYLLTACGEDSGLRRGHALETLLCPCPGLLNPAGCVRRHS